ncbi:protein phosphatase 1 regulatory subunit 14C isoform X2 [Folsomia candida]|nr:protein phosphatase 1 regulatory subunit 14C isoform X2 [Folsomia candida]XP_035715331.1 protein phosphatase 1 regulatory subunit 14C isoform X2 [Folsomia candida]XP_035715332.1 protein phosphatase 1 regulatory subunit 14C isoform X2 [Folsomia candida]XP_035715333.1 protein phosphatase 1 regulatory subunit 14C isoform X2 [Folsomia candida]
MECEVSSTQPAAYNGAGSRSSPPSASVVTSSSPVPKTGGGSGKSQLHVDFIEHGEVKEKREKYLTAKYGSHQMSLIRKRLAVEMWLYDELQKLYEDEEGTSSTHDVEIDLDEVLDMDGDEERRKFLLPLLVDAKKSQDIVNKFVDEVISKAKTL